MLALGGKAVQLEQFRREELVLLNDALKYWISKSDKGVIAVLQNEIKIWEEISLPIKN